MPKRIHTPPRSESVLYNRSVDGGSSGAIWKRTREPRRMILLCVQGLTPADTVRARSVWVGLESLHSHTPPQFSTKAASDRPPSKSVLQQSRPVMSRRPSTRPS